MGRIRTFIGIPAGRDAGDAMARFISSISPHCRGVRWEPQDKFHVTLKFLGDTDESILPEILTIMRKCASGLEQFRITTGGLGIFPSRGQAGVCWIDCVDNGGSLSILQDALERDLEGLGFPRDDRPFHPHFTIGRMRDEGVRHHLTSLSKNSTFDPRHTIVNEIFLMKSVIKPGGSEYSVVGSAKLS